ncbi:MAG: RQC domain-containing protein, partial [Pyrinomonadaceae bacterium]|nr:RQC domain-containing protein [Pyrinomonadaceae bacterium]
RSCRRAFLLNYFDETFEGPCDNCDNCGTEFETFDGTVIAQKALSAVARTGQRFGTGYLVDLLRGSKSSKLKLEHLNLKTYGVGADISKADWFDYFKQLMEQGFLRQADGTYPTLALTEKSEAVLRGEAEVRLYRTSVAEERAASGGAGSERDEALFDRLRAVRARLAAAEDVPPYIVFSDQTLSELATYFPQEAEELRQISGVGDWKLTKYGPAILGELRDYCSERGIASRPKRRSRERKSTPRRTDGASTFAVSYRMFRAGSSIAEIAAERGLTVTTIEGHLARYIETGDIDLEELVPAEKADVIRKALAENGGEALGPVKAALGEDYSYGEIRAVIADLARER